VTPTSFLRLLVFVSRSLFAYVPEYSIRNEVEACITQLKKENDTRNPVYFFRIKIHVTKIDALEDFIK
jgi:hypothetical protein